MIVARVIIREQQGKFSQIVTRIVMKKLQILTLNLLFFRVTLFCRETEREAAEEKRKSKSLVTLVQEGKEGSQMSLTRGEGTPTVTTWVNLRAW